MIKHCTCSHAFQDARYGPGMRVHTISAKGEARCTVCGGPARWIVRVGQHYTNPGAPSVFMKDASLGEKLCTENRIASHRS